MSYYEKRPVIKTDGVLISGWEEVLKNMERLIKTNKSLVVDCYSGVYIDEIKNWIKQIPVDSFIDTRDIFKKESEIRNLTGRMLTDDVLFGYLTYLHIGDYFDPDKLQQARQAISDDSEKVIIFGYGATKVFAGGALIYFDLPRWEIRQRMRRKEVNGLGVNNSSDYISLQYKRGYFNDWKILDRYKQTIYQKVDFWVDTVDMEEPKMIDRKTFENGIEKASSSPFRVVPFFDPAPWGGQWMKEKFGLDKSVANYGWCFDCVPEENSLLLDVDGKEFEMPANNLVYLESKSLLGGRVESRFGKEFPIRFDFLDTIGGGNLSLQVHPTTEFVKNNFGLSYTQDESYYLMDAQSDATVYLGVKNGTDSASMIADLKNAGEGRAFDADEYVNIFKAKKHDHFLIPAGTIHCSGRNSVVLEISATPNLFTFKLWDWGRLGLDGRPRPLNINRGEKVIAWERDRDFAEKELINQFVVIEKGDGWAEEKTGLHEKEFIETRRHTFSKPVLHDTMNSVNVLNLVEGEEIIVESVDGSFEPLIIHYAETFIIPEKIKKYMITPSGPSVGKVCKTMKAFVRC